MGAYVVVVDERSNWPGVVGWLSLSFEMVEVIGVFGSGEVFGLGTGAFDFHML